MQARAAVASGGGGRSRSWLRWSAPLALAASVVLVVTVVIESGVQDDTSFATKAVDEVRRERRSDRMHEHQLRGGLLQSPTQPPEQFAPEPAAMRHSARRRAGAGVAASGGDSPRPRRSARRDVAPEEVRVDARAVRDQSQAVSALSSRRRSIREMRSSQPSSRHRLAGSVATISARKEVDRAAAEAEADSADDSVGEIVTGNRVRRAARGALPVRATRSPARHSAVRRGRPPSTERREQSDPEQWLEEIRDLRRAGKVADADREWQEFRKSFPDFRVADDDIARKKP